MKEKLEIIQGEYKKKGLSGVFGKINDKLVRELSHYPQYRLYNRYWEQTRGSGTSVLEKDWDNLIVLDACRYDEFVKLNPFEKNAEKRITLGSNTTGFLQKTFLGEKLYDTVHVTASPKSLKLESGKYGSERIFYAIVSLLEDEYWDSENHTVMPETVRKKTLETQDKHPNKRLFIQFEQPHIPYIGKEANEFKKAHGISIGGLSVKGRDYIKADFSPDIETVGLEVIGDDKYNVTADDVLRMYRESLSITLKEVEKLVAGLEGKTAITADHGEMFGERPFIFSERVYGHPQRRRSDELCIVPWLEIESENRKTTTSDPPTERDTISDTLLDDRLEALGYK